MLLAQEFICSLPNNEIPEKTEDYEGFFHLHHQHGSVETTTLEYIIRDHDKTLFDK